MSNDLIPLEGIESNVAALGAVSTAGNFLPRLQLFGSSSNACKEGKIQIAHWGLSRDKDSIEDLGKEVDIVVLCGVPKAMQITDDGVLVQYDKDSAEFARMIAEADDKVDGTMYGSEFLVWVGGPHRPSQPCFMCSPTARREAPKVIQRIGKAATLSSKLIKTDKYSWHGPVVKPLETPTFDMPESVDAIKHARAFMGRKSSTLEKDSPAAAAETGGRER